MRSRLRPFAIAALVLAHPSSVPGGSAQTTPCTSTPYDCAVAQVQRGEFTAAIPALEALASQPPADIRVLNLLGIALTGAGRLDDANARFRAALAIDPRFAPVLRNLGVNELTLRHLPEAQRLLESVLAQSPGDEVAHLHLAEIAIARNDYLGALAHYEKSGQRTAQNPRWGLHHATALLAANRRSEASALMDRLPQRDPEAWFDAGVLFGKYRAHAEAARFFAQARRLGYKDAYAAGYNQILMLIEARQYEGAIAVAEELIASGVKPAELYNLASRAYAGADRIAEAYDALRQATRLEPAVAEHYIDMAMLCLEHENYELALEIVDIGLRHRPDANVLYLQRGVVLAMKGASDGAEQSFSRARELAPQDASAHVALAMVWMQSGRTAKAVEMLRTKATSPDLSSQAVLQYALGVALLRSGAAPEDAEATEALQAFRRAVELMPSFSPAQAELGKLLLKRNDVSGATAHLEQAVALDPESSAAAYVLAQAYRRAGDVDRARELLTRVSRLNARERGDDPDTDLRRAMFRIVRDGARIAAPPATAVVDAAAARAAACAAAGDLDGAIETLRKTAADFPDTPGVRYQLAIALWNRHQRAARRSPGDLEEAVKALSRAVEQDGSQARFHRALGQVLAEQQQFSAAIPHLQRSIALAPQDPEGPYNLGLAFRLQGNLDAAEAQFRSTLAMHAEHGLARRSLGLVLRQKGELPAAAKELRRAVASVPAGAMEHHLLGSVLLRLGQTSDAIAELQTAVRLDRSLVEAHVLLAQALARRGDAAAARLEQQEVERINAGNAARGRALVLLDSAAALLVKGDVPGAIRQLREAVDAAPELAEAHYELGLALQRMDAASRDADDAFRQALSLDPTLARAHAARARLLDARGDTAGARAARSRAAELAPCSLAAGTP